MADIKNQLEKIISWLNEYKEKTNCKGVVLGISGGKDSTVVAMLAKKVWGDNVVGVLMPNGEQTDINDSFAVANALNLDHLGVNINGIYNQLCHSVEIGATCSPWLKDEKAKIKISDKAKTNIPPRIRMTVLYAIAQSLGYRVIGTGNESERHIGWTTKWGDSACDLNPIAHLSCSRVIELGKELCKDFSLDKKFIIKKPSDGLTGKSDEDNFGFTYEDLDTYISGGRISTEIAEKIDKMHESSKHKRLMPYMINDVF